MSSQRRRRLLLERSRALRAIVDDAPVGIALLDPTGRGVRVNLRLARWLGYDIRQLTRMRLADLCAPEEPAWDTDLPALLEGTLSLSRQQRRLRRRDGGWLTARIRMSVYRPAVGGPLLVGVFDDGADGDDAPTTESVRLDATGDLAGSVAHDFNNVLTAIGGFTSLLLQSLPVHDPARADVQALAEAGERAADLTRQLLAFGQRQLLRPVTLDLLAVVRQASPALQALCGPGVRVEVIGDRDSRLVKADRGQIEQVLHNLVANARDALGGTGAITITVRDADVDEAPIAGRGVRPGRFASLTVSDDGPGILPDVRTRIFEPYFTTRGRDTARGLGLSAAYGIVRQSGGWIGVTSEPGRGSTFTVYLPEAEPTTAPTQMPQQAGERLAGTETILVVDDQPDVRSMTRLVLQRFGYGVIAAASADQAIAAVAQAGAPPDLLLTDVALGGTSGPELARALRQRVPTLPVLFMSGEADRSQLGPVEVADDAAFVAKPFTAISLARSVRQALDRAAGRGA